MWDVIVVGAGPGGCAAATLLARAGLRVVILDKAAAPPPKVCGEYLSPGCLRILERIGALNLVRAAGARPLRVMVIHTRGGQTLRANYPASPAGARDHGLAIRRASLDPILLDVAITSGVEFMSHFQVTDLVWTGSRVAGVQGRHRGQAACLRARLIIGADGRNSLVARRLGAVERHGWLDKIAMVGYLEGVRREDDVGEIFLGKDRYCILNPIAPDLVNIGLVLNRREFQSASDPTGSLLKTARSLPHLGDRLAQARPMAPPRCLGPLAYSVTRLTAPGALLIGDAAGFLDPFTGEGIHAALRSAELAAGFAVPALAADSAPMPDLSGYAEAWGREQRAKWRLCTGLQHAIRHPLLADGIARFLSHRRDLATLLMAAVGDLLPACDLTLTRFLPLPLLPGPPAASPSASG